jgi:hypothetical protein
MRDKKIYTKVISWVMTIAMIVGLFSYASQIKVTASGAETTPGTLVAHWTFDGNYNESSSGLSTELGAQSLTYTNGIHDKAAVFNGKDNYLVVDANEILNLGNSRDTDNSNFTASAWIKLADSDTSDKYLLDKGMEWGWGQNDSYYWTNPYRIYFAGCGPRVYLSNNFMDATVDPNYITEGFSSAGDKYVEAGEWFLLTVTYDGKRIKIYHDNELLSQSNYSDGITFNNDELFIGVDYTLTNFFEGCVDDLRIYTNAFTYDQVAALYQQGVAANKDLLEPTKQLVAYYAFDGDLKDSSDFNNEAEAIGTSSTTGYDVGKNGMAIKMLKGGYILVPAADQLNFDTEFTVSFWIKLDKEGSFPVLCRQNPYYGDNNDNEYTYITSINSWSDAEFTSMSMNTMVYDPNTWCMVGGQSLSSDFSYSEDKIKGTNWFHYTYTYQDGQMKCYLNGVLQDKSDTSDLINIANASGDLLIGYDGSSFMSGSIDELKIYNSCLSVTEVAQEAKRIDSISLSKATVKSIANIGKGKTVNISSILLKDVDHEKNIDIKLPGKNITLKSSNTKIFTVSADGKITGVKAGKANLTISYGPHKVTYKVVVK